MELHFITAQLGIASFSSNLCYQPPGTASLHSWQKYLAGSLQTEKQ